MKLVVRSGTGVAAILGIKVLAERLSLNNLYAFRNPKAE